MRRLAGFAMSAGLRSARLLGMGDYRRLAVWIAARRLATLTYAATAGFPPRERYGLAHQMRRAAVSVASNIAEGAGRGSDREFARFLRIARGSLQELNTQLLIAGDLRMGDPARLAELAAAASEAGRLLFGLTRRIAPRTPKT